MLLFKIKILMTIFDNKTATFIVIYFVNNCILVFCIDYSHSSTNIQTNRNILSNETVKFGLVST